MKSRLFASSVAFAVVVELESIDAGMEGTGVAVLELDAEVLARPLADDSRHRLAAAAVVAELVIFEDRAETVIITQNILVTGRLT